MIYANICGEVCAPCASRRTQSILCYFTAKNLRYHWMDAEHETWCRTTRERTFICLSDINALTVPDNGTMSVNQPLIPTYISVFRYAYLLVSILFCTGDTGVYLPLMRRTHSLMVNNVLPVDGPISRPICGTYFLHYYLWNRIQITHVTLSTCQTNVWNVISVI